MTFGTSTIIVQKVVSLIIIDNDKWVIRLWYGDIRRTLVIKRIQLLMQAICFEYR